MHNVLQLLSFQIGKQHPGMMDGEGVVGLAGDHQLMTALVNPTTSQCLDVITNDGTDQNGEPQ